MEFFVTYFLTILAADVVGLMLSSMVRTTELAMTIMPFLLIFELIFSGSFFRINGPIGQLSAATICEYSMTAACISTDYNNLEDTEKYKIIQKLHAMIENQDLPVTYDQVEQLVEENYDVPFIDAYSHTRLNLVKQWGALVIHAMITALIGILALKLIDFDKR